MDLNTKCKYVKHNNDILPFYFLKLLEGKYGEESIVLDEIYEYYKNGLINLKEKGSNNKYFFEYIVSPYYLWDKKSEEVDKNNEIYQNLYLKDFIFDYIKIFPAEILNIRNSYNENIVTTLGQFELKRLFKEFNEKNYEYFTKVDLNVINGENLHFITKILNIDYLDDEDIYCLDILINKLNIDLTIEIKDPAIPLYTYIDKSLQTHEKLKYSQTKYFDIFKEKLQISQSIYEKKKINNNINGQLNVYNLYDEEKENKRL